MMDDRTNYPIMVICGSTRFMEDFIRESKRLTLDGYLVLSPHSFDKSEKDALSNSQIDMLVSMHFQKINLADEIFVINKNGYIGESTFMEIVYAAKLGLPINYMEPKYHIIEKEQGNVQ